MPLYEYKCPKCEKLVEIMQKVSDPPPTCMCVESATTEMVKQISLSNFHLKGSGWHKNDYSRKT